MSGERTWLPLVILPQVLTWGNFMSAQKYQDFVTCVIATGLITIAIATDLVNTAIAVDLVNTGKLISLL